MKSSRVVLCVCLALGSSLTWAGCRCGLTIGKKAKNRARVEGLSGKTEGRLPHERLLDQAEKAKKDGDWVAAVRLALRGLTEWTRRAGYDSARAKRYENLLDRVLAAGGLQAYLEFCFQPSTRAGSIVCSRSAATHLHATADDGKPAPSAIALYESVCLADQSSAMSGACGSVPTALVADPTVLPKVRAKLAKGCLSRPMDGDLAQMCESAALAAWVVAVHRWDVNLLGEAGRALMAQDRATGIAMALRLLSQAGPVPQAAADFVEKLLIRALGSAGGLTDLQVAFFQRFGPEQRKAVASWARKRLDGREQDVAAVLDVLDAKDASKLLARFAEFRELKSLVDKTRPFLGHSMARGEVEAYLRSGKGGRVGRARALEYLRSHPSYFESRVIGQVATLPSGARKRLVDIIAEVQPEARFGSLSGMVVRKGVKSKRCRVFLSRLERCTYRPGGKQPARRTLRVGVRFMKVRKGVYSALTTANGGVFMRRIPVGPYRMWVWCADMNRAKAVWKISYDRKQSKILSVVCPVVIQPERENQVRALQVDWVPQDEGTVDGAPSQIVGPVPKGAYHAPADKRR